MSGGKGEESSRLYAILSHPMRREIIRILGERGVVGFTELRRLLKTSVGTLYYHFDVLGDLITQDERRKYRLTERGRLAYRTLMGEGEGLKAEEEMGPARAFLASLLAPRGLFTHLYSSPLRFVPQAAMILIYGAWAFSQSGLEPVGIFITPRAAASSSLVMVEFLVGWLAISLFSEFLSLLLFGRRGGELDLLVGIAFSLLPLLVFPSLLLLNINLGLGLPLAGNPALDILFFILQAWTLCLLTTAIASAKGLRIDRAAIISLTVLYLNIGYILLLRRPL